MPSARSQTKEGMLCNPIYMKHPQQINPQGDTQDWWWPEAGKGAGE